MGWQKLLRKSCCEPGKVTIGLVKVAVETEEVTAPSTRKARYEPDKSRLRSKALKSRWSVVDLEKVTIGLVKVSSAQICYWAGYKSHRVGRRRRQRKSSVGLGKVPCNRKKSMPSRKLSTTQKMSVWEKCPSNQKK